MSRGRTGRGRTRNTRRGAAVALVLVIGLVGCGLRPSKEVRVDKRVDVTASQGPDIRRLLPKPEPGESPEQVVSGFVTAAAATPQVTSAQARAFLAPGATWDDSAGSTIYDAASLTVRAVPSPPQANGNTAMVLIQGQRLATLDAGGAYFPVAGRFDLAVQLQRVGPDWRILRAPPGLLLSPTDLDRNYHAVRRYMLALDRDILVPDPVYVSGTRPTLAGAAVRSVLAGPSAWLAPAVHTAVPPGLTLLGSVVVNQGSAIVDLDRVAFGVPTNKRPLLVGQIAATLGSLPWVDQVGVLSEGRAYDESDPMRPAEVPPALRPDDNAPTFAVDPAGQLLQLQEPQPGEAPAGLVPASGAPDRLVSAVADPAGSRSVAAIRSGAIGGIQLWMGQLGSMHRILLPSDPLTAPTWVPGHGVVVLLKGIGLVLVSPSGTTSTISDSRLGLLGTPQQVAVSPDGTRIALRTGPAQPGSSPAEPGEPVEPSTVWVGRLARHGSAIAAEAWLPVATGVQDVAELAWSGPAELLVTGRRTDSPVALWRVDLARLADPVRLAGAGLPAVPGPVSASDGASPLVVDAGHAWRLDGERWTDLGPVRAVARPH